MYLNRQVLCECLRYNSCGCYRKHSHSTSLSKYIWELKDKGTDHEIKWSIINRAKPYSGKPSRCNLCLAEKFSLQYVGSTSTEFKVRFWNHKSAMTTRKKTCEVTVISIIVNIPYMILLLFALNK